MNTPIIECKNISKKFYVETPILKRRIKEIIALENVNFTLQKGEILGIVGESGSGKTTLAKILCGFIEPDGGTILFDGEEKQKYKRHELSKKVQMVFQDPFSSLNPRLSIGTIIGEAVEMNFKFKGIKGDKIIKIKELLNAVGLPTDLINNYPHQLSGGQRQRVAIARSLAMEPEVLVADEPFSNLDLITQAEMVNLFLELKKIFGFSTIFISHDILLVNFLSDRILVMKSGKIVEESSCMEIINNPKSDYTKELIKATIM